MVIQAEKQINQDPSPEQNKNEQTDRLTITYYTDPLCCWSWCFEKIWTELLAEFEGKIQTRYVMCGMIPNWVSYKDPFNSVNKPCQMGPVWMHAAQLTKTKINFNIWHKDPPASSYPACQAVKTAALQSRRAERVFLFKVREAVMVRELNIVKQDVLFQIAEEIAIEIPEHFNFKLFKKDWTGEKAHSLLRNDLQLAALHKIGRYPTLTCTNNFGKGIILVGYRPYEILKNDLKQMGLHGCSLL